MNQTLRTVGAAALLLGATAAGAQAFPSKPIRVVIPFVAGGSSDIVGRAISSKWKRRIVIDITSHVMPL